MWPQRRDHRWRSRCAAASADLGYTAEDRSENLRRSAHLAHALNEAGCLHCLVCRPWRSGRQGRHDDRCRPLPVVHVATPVEVCRQRDTKGQYRKADAGELKNFPGVTAIYEPPASPDLVISADADSVDQCAEKIIALLRERQFIR